MAKIPLYVGKKVASMSSQFRGDYLFRDLAKQLRREVNPFKNARKDLKSESKNVCSWFQLVLPHKVDEAKRFRNKEVAAVCALVFDIDGGITFDACEKMLDSRGLNYFAYTSFNHQFAKDDAVACDRFRIVIEIVEPIPAPVYKSVYTVVGDELFGRGNWDTSTSDPARIWFAPVTFGEEHCDFRENFEGAALEWQKFQIVPPVANRQATRPKRSNTDVFCETLCQLLETNGFHGRTPADEPSSYYLIRPGKEEGNSVKVFPGDSDGTPLVYVYSSNAHPFEAQKTYTFAKCLKLFNPHLNSPKGPAMAKVTENEEQITLENVVFEAIDTGEVELWHSTEKVPHVTFRHRNQFCHDVPKSQLFSSWLTEKSLDIKPNETVSLGVKSRIINTLEGIALSRGKTYRISSRMAWLGDSIYVDLADEQDRVVVITKEGWGVSNNASGIKFLKKPGQLGLPIPIEGGCLKSLGQIFPMSDENLTLAIGWLLASFKKPEGGFPLLIVNGEQGSGKSELCRLLRTFIDPHETMLSTMPKDEKDMLIVAKQSRVLVYDNLSYISPEQSDLLASIATGTGREARQLYTDSAVISITASVPIIVNGISDFVTRHDLKQRCFFINLERIAEENRRSATDIKRDFLKHFPELLGALFSRLSSALREYETCTVPGSHRMMDAVRWVHASEPNEERGDFFRCLKRNEQEANDSSLENDPVAKYLIQLVTGELRIALTSSELFERIKEEYLEGHGHFLPPGVPKTANALSAHVKRIAPALRMVGVSVEYKKTNQRRETIFAKTSLQNLTDEQRKTLSECEDTAEFYAQLHEYGATPQEEK